MHPTVGLPSPRIAVFQVVFPQFFSPEPASAPRLGVDPPSGVVSEDRPLRLTCVASRDDFKLRFGFYRNGVKIPPGQAGSETRNAGNSSELHFPRSPRSFSGKFSCEVEEEVGGTWVPSPQSEAVDVTVKGRSALGSPSEGWGSSEIGPQIQAKDSKIGETSRGKMVETSRFSSLSHGGQPKSLKRSLWVF